MRLDPHGEASTFPRRADLPHIAGTPEDSEWFWGGSDELGRLNLLTAERIRKATNSVTTGHVVSLNLPLNIPDPALFGRKGLHHQIHKLGPGAFNDDQLTYNTQSSSQWDGFRHFADPKSGFFYNGLKTDDLSREEGDDLSLTTRLGIDAWAKRGIVGRGVLLDVYGWKKESYDPFTDHPITASDLSECARSQGVNFETGDILLVRTGWLSRYASLNAVEREKRAAMDAFEQSYSGLQASEDMKDFLHDNYFAAAATDSANFEAWPSPSLEKSLHATLLPLWGMPIGELWHLEELATACKELGRWHFLLTSSPGNVPGGVGSPPNALAIL
ncbi:putative cyclase [Aaosphaeria arxii CBS 175.79]|uniref:Putative cyclase n=1 Tax=Aaosphaeria arxii CBS 175.79 TaxID=1450172 RepID=A0A6A5XLH5_9PLEO|nr:putative cyclase [Aaosphaeria arxii CBS 175.79]KAF2014115.1 putative cyclase [Aaosphaeria arxii CBS 175.79]